MKYDATSSMNRSKSRHFECCVDSNLARGSAALDRKIVNPTVSTTSMIALIIGYTR